MQWTMIVADEALCCGWGCSIPACHNPAKELWSMVAFSLAGRAKSLKRRLSVGRQLLAVARERDELLLQLAASRKDPLTGLMNRLAFMAAMKERASAALGGAMMLVDLDAFKCFNDSNGHQVGDLLLRSLADRLQGWASPDALLARGGGDEFLIHLPRVSLSDAQAESEALMKLVRAPLKANGQNHVVTCSVGLSACHGLEPDEILRRADIALYAAKHRGRNQVVAYGDGVSNIPAARRELAAIVMDLQRQLAAVRD